MPKAMIEGVSRPREVAEAVKGGGENKQCVFPLTKGPEGGKQTSGVLMLGW